MCVYVYEYIYLGMYDVTILYDGCTPRARVHARGVHVRVCKGVRVCIFCHSHSILAVSLTGACRSYTLGLYTTGAGHTLLYYTHARAWLENGESQSARASECERKKKHTHTRTHAHLLRPELFRCDCCWTAAVLSDVAIHTCSMHITMTMIVVNGNT